MTHDQTETDPTRIDAADVAAALGTDSPPEPAGTAEGKPTEGHVAHKERLLELNPGLELWEVHVDALREQDVNAQSMSPQMMDRLTATVERDRRLESLPFCADTGRKQFEVVSGHHRVRAARAAGVPTIHVLVDTTGLSRSQIAAKQLAHNSINGHSEAQLVKRIFESIEDVDARLEAFVDEKAINVGIPDPIDLPKVDLNVDYKTTLITWLPHQHERFAAAVEALEGAGQFADRDEILLVDKGMNDQWQATMSRLRKEYDARAVAVVISRFLRAAADLLGIEGDDPADVDPTEWVPLVDILGSAMVPPDAAPVIRDAIERIAKDEGIKGRQKWRALEYLAADYCAGH